MRVQLTFGFLLSIFNILAIITVEIQPELPSEFSEEDHIRLKRLNLSDITGKGLQFTILINKTKDGNIDPNVYDILGRVAINMERLRDDIIQLRDEVKACGNVSSINKCHSWKVVFNCCLIHAETELWAIKNLTNIISVRAKMIKDLNYQLRLKPVNKELLKKTISQLDLAMNQLANGNISSDCRRTIEKVPNALVKFGKTLFIARTYIQIQLNRLEKPKEFFLRPLQDF